jgi:hypothetical protein
MSAKTIWSIVAASGLLVCLASAGPGADAKDARNDAQAKKDAPAKKTPRPPRPPVVPGPCYLDPNEAGPDYAVQGEYVGAAGNDKIGVQVVATGKGQFTAVIYQDGLPGDGYARDKKKVSIQGATKDGKTVFEGAADKYEAVIEAGKLTGRTDTGEKISARRIVRTSPTLGAKCPAGGTVLFDGTSTEAWINARVDKRGLLEIDAETKADLPDCTLHVEFLLPFKPETRGQDRGNSGVYLQRRYEIQVLDSFGLEGRTGECGAMYMKVAPLVNMCYPPLTWQTYDIEFESAKWQDGKKVKDMSLTVRHNGVVVQDNIHLKGPTGVGRKESPEGGPLWLQGHKNPVFYRNIWIVPRK